MAQKIEKSTKKFELIVVIFFSVFALTVSQLIGRQTYYRELCGAALFTLPSTVFLLLRHKKPMQKILLGSLVFGTLLGFFFEFLMQSSGGYSVVSTFLPRLFGQVPIDSVLTHTLMACLILTFYEHFVYSEKPTKIPLRFKYALGLVLLLDVAVVAVHYIRPGTLTVPYPYMVFGIVAIMPMAVKAYLQPRFALKLLALIPFFFLTFMLFMIAAIHFSWWIYPSTTHYIGQVSLITNVKFPFEELLFWMLLYAPAIVTYYSLTFSSKKEFS